MKAPPFEYHAPATLTEAIEVLSSLEDARPLAGGQSLMPMLNLRAAAPGHLIDLNNIADLRGIRETRSTLIFGAMTTQRAIELSSLVRIHCPLLSEAIDHVGHQQTRNRGTIGGSVCHLDPGAELPVAAAVLNSQLTLTGPNGARTLPFSEFPAGYLTTVIEPDEIMTSIEVQKCGELPGYAFLEFNQRPADFAVVSVAVLLALHGEEVTEARIALGGVHYAPVRLEEAESGLIGKKFSDVSVTTAAKSASAFPCEGDEVSPAKFRQHLAGVFVRRALHKAYARAKGSL